MKWLLVLSMLTGGVYGSAQSTASEPLATVQPYSGTIWTTITFQLANGNTRTATQRTLVSRDAAGNWKQEVYRLTNGPVHDTSAALDHVLTGQTLYQPDSLAPSQSSGETLIEDLDLGTLSFSGLSATGRRRTFSSVSQPQQTHTLETWFSPTLGTILHSKSLNFSGTMIVTDLSDIYLGAPVAQQSQQ